MTALHHHPSPDIVRFNPRAFLAKEWPYLAVLLLAFFGIAYSSVSKKPMTFYWIILAPFIGLICVTSGWPDAQGPEQRLRLVRTQVLHWGAVLFSMYLMSVADVIRIMSAPANALAAMTLLALGAFTAGIHVASLPVCIVGIVLAVAIPAIAWLEESALLLLLGTTFLAAVVVPLFWHHKRQSPHRALSS